MKVGVVKWRREENYLQKREKSMDWKRKFARTILERGKYYYVHKYVQGLRYKDYIYKAQVIGSYIYQVEIKIRNQEPVYMMCSCPHAQKGNYCKHMAAFMYGVESDRS